ncbi:DNA ligase, NAD-dependent [Lachnospiraceae bacterium A4]|nr:DNA ligase, NAD-dependent [Lachnospiraceae bacterium A4]
MLQKARYIRDLVKKLNQYRHEYYNENASSVSDAVYDHLYNELERMEKETGIVLSNSPTQTVGYKSVYGLQKVQHSIPLLSLDKTKMAHELVSFLKKREALLMLKLDGLTIKLVYENGELVEGSTRGDGHEGELVTHNINAFQNVPLSIPYKGRLVLTGEGFIHKNDFERLKGTLVGSDGKPYRNARNLASGSIRCLDASVCKQRKISFCVFNILEGMDEFKDLRDSRCRMLSVLKNYGFEVCPFIPVSPDASVENIEMQIKTLKDLAEINDIPIDGMVLRFDSFSYSESLGRTGHHYNDGIAFKFEDDTYETIFRSIEWQTGRSGEIAPVAVFDTIEIDGCDVSRASLHNLSFIEGLELHPGCRILVSKRNMIIPHVEENLDRENYQDMTPQFCPCCGQPTRTYSRAGDKGRIIKTLHCDNPECDSRILQRFVHFTEKKAMNIRGISEATLDQFIQLGALKSYQDLYHLDRYRDQIIALEGFGEKSYENMILSINRSRNTTFERYIVAMDIPLIGRTAGRLLDQYFHGNLRELEMAAVSRFDFTRIDGIGDIMSRNIQEWFRNSDHLLLWRGLQKELHFENGLDAETSGEENNMNETINNKFAGCTIVATGKLENFTRDGINDKIISLGAKPGSSVTKKTDYLICGEKAGSKLQKARELGVTVLTEQQFLEMLTA